MKENKFEIKQINKLYLVCAISFFTATNRDLMFTREWNREINLIQFSEELKTNHCADMIDGNTYFSDLRYMALEATYLSIMIQNKKNIDWVLAETMTSRCQEIFAEQKITFLKNLPYQHSIDFKDKTYFDFSKIQNLDIPIIKHY